MPLKMLRSITQDINSGRPVWGLLCCNEYLGFKDPLGHVLRKKAKQKIEQSFALSDSELRTVESICSGRKLSELAKGDIKQLLKQDQRVVQNSRHVARVYPKRRRNLTSHTPVSGRKLRVG